MNRKKTFGPFEAVFDLVYLATVMCLGGYLLLTAGNTPGRILYGVMALTLAVGDAFHLVPRVLTVYRGETETLGRRLGRGKMYTSIGMTLFYLMLWHVGLLAFAPTEMEIPTVIVYFLASMRVTLCLLPRNRWAQDDAPASWNTMRNLPFFLLGAMVGVLFFLRRDAGAAFHWMWLAVLLSFGFYIPVVLWSKKVPALGMLMVPKTCAYVWIVAMGLQAFR